MGGPGETQIESDRRIISGLSYSEFMHKAKKKNITLNRKVLADLAMNNQNAFEAIVKAVK